MKYQKLLTALGASAGMLVLILDSKTALAGAREGVELCLMTLIPSLFPFFVVSVLLTGALSGTKIAILEPVGRLCRIPAGSEFLLAIGLLGGYPVGAQNIALACSSGQLSKADARRMMGFCNNAGPAFLFGMIAPMFRHSGTVWLLWGIHILSAILVGLAIPGEASSPVCEHRRRLITFPDALEKAVRTMALICGWVIIFRTILAFLDRWIFWALSKETAVIISGILELSNGCVQLGSIPCEGLRFLISGVLLSLGGICVAMQTASVCNGLSLRFYFPGKLLQCCFTVLLSTVCQNWFPENQRWSFHPFFVPAVMLCTIFLLVSLQKIKKSCSIPAIVGV